jgi:hypothetical protein
VLDFYSIRNSARHFESMQQDSPVSGSTLTPRDSQSDGPSSKITRKSHRKSRAGCTHCKSRRIKVRRPSFYVHITIQNLSAFKACLATFPMVMHKKSTRDAPWRNSHLSFLLFTFYVRSTNNRQCDEAKPHCTNCVRRQVRCSFAVGLPRPGSTASELPRESVGLRISEIELTYHWSTTTSHSLSAWESGATVWRTLLEEVALHHHHVLHLMFALTALQLAHCRPDREAEYRATADHHYERALADVTRSMKNISSGNCDAILISVQLICFVNWARGPQPGDYLAFADRGTSDWLLMFRGIRTTLESFGRENFKTHASAVESRSRPLPPMHEPLGYQKQLAELREHVSATSSPSESEANVRAMDILQECYSNRYKGVDSEYHVVFAWLYKMSDDFLDHLQQRDVIPLTIYAHFVVLMHEMERFWYMKGWTHHVMRGIFEALSREQTAWIRWPMARVGWIAP